MLTEARREVAPELDASFSAVNLRSAGLRVGVHRGRNVTSDFTLVARASPFLERCDRLGLTLVLDGRGRFDEKGRTGWLGPGDLVIDDQREGGTEAYAGADSTWVVLECAADRYALPWAHWRSALHHARIAQAIRWLGARGATTELVARLTGYRSPTSLCHAFARAGLPSPGALAHAARRDALVAWAPAWPSRLGYTGSIDARPLGPRAGEP